MPLYRILKDTFICHDNRQVNAGTVAEIEWPPGTEPRTLGSNMQKARPGDVPGAKFSYAAPDDEPVWTTPANVRKSREKA